MSLNRLHALSAAAVFVLAAAISPVIGLSQTTPAAATRGAPTTDAATAPREAAVVPSAKAPDASQASSARPADAKGVEVHKVNGDTVTCREARVTGSRLRTRRICTSTASEKAASDWADDQQARGGMAGSAAVNGGG